VTILVHFILTKYEYWPMKRINLILVFLALISISFAQDNSQPAPSNIRGAQYPQITSDSRALFKIKASGAEKMQIDLGRKYDMVKNSDGVWEVTTDSLTEGFHYYSLVIDGVPVADPSSESFYGMGRMASGIEVPFKGDDYYAEKNVPHGDIRIKRYYSSILASWRPPSFTWKPAERFASLPARRHGRFQKVTALKLSKNISANWRPTKSCRWTTCLSSRRSRLSCGIATCRGVRSAGCSAGNVATGSRIAANWCGKARSFAGPATVIGIIRSWSRTEVRPAPPLREKGQPLFLLPD